LKIADFGWSIITTKPRKTLCGTLDYLSPEVANKESYNNKIDCWSIGVLMYELITGQAPFQQQK
jgi:aurora kinase